jgi:multiple antibiotic resistance protein
VTAFILASFTAFLVTLNPVESAALFSALTAGWDRSARRSVAVKAAAVAGGLMVVFLILGDDLLRVMGISLAGVRVGGGILLLLVSIDLVFGRATHTANGTDPARPSDISVFPLATPIIAGPGAITAALVQASEAHNDLLLNVILLALLGAVMLLILGAMLIADHLQRWLGGTGIDVIMRMLGLLLTALAAEMILAGIRQSGAFVR